MGKVPDHNKGTKERTVKEGVKILDLVGIQCFQFVISGQIRGDDVHPVAPTATGTLFLSRSES